MLFDTCHSADLPLSILIVMDGLDFEQEILAELICVVPLIGQTNLASSNVVAIVDVLEERGFVVRRRDPEDRRIINVSIAQDGRKYIERVFPMHVGTIVEELSCLTAGEQDELARLCRKLGLNERA